MGTQHTHRTRSLGILLLFAVLAAAPSARAQDEGFDAHGFYLTAQDGDPRDLLGVRRPGRFEAGEWGVGGVLEYAHRPLVLVRTVEDGETVEPALAHLLGVNLAAGMAVHDRVWLDATAPLYFDVRDAQGSRGAGVGDVRLAAMLALVRPERSVDGGGIGVGLVPHLDLPTGSPDTFTGQPGVAGGVRGAATWEGPRWTGAADLGVQFNPAIEARNLTGSDQLTWSVGGGFLATPASAVNLEVRGAAPLEKNPEPGTGAPIEVLLHGRHLRDNGASLLVGGAAALSRGASAAAWRVFVGGGFGTARPLVEGDRDLDGFLDKDDGCPDDPEVVNDWRDEDGCPDDLASLELEVWVDGAPASGVGLVLAGPTGEQRVKSRGRGLSLDLLPGTWTVRTDDEGVSPVEHTVELGEGPHPLRLDLITPPGTLRVTLEKPDGTPVGAHVVLGGEHAPEAGLVVGADGTGAVDLRAGEYEVYLAVPGFATVEGVVVIRPGETEELMIRLKPGTVVVTAERIAIQERILFEFDRAILRPESFPVLDEVAGAIRKEVTGVVEVQGHADAKGSAQYNLGLSQRRAEAVRAYLVGKGIPSERLVARGYGDTQPIASNATAVGREQNRRVEFVLLGEQTDGN